ncbi:MAG TPA: DnaJ domain-containing protein [Haliangium sp.]|nr:DnaJ domain-containing protein [Haliangium sp.]
MRTLKVKCPTWHHVETFYSRKLRKDRTLTLRVPFEPEEGAQISVGLELPDGEVVNIPGTIIGVSTGEDEDRNAMRLFLHGLDAELLDRLKAKVAAAEASTAKPAAPPQPPSAQATGPSSARAQGKASGQASAQASPRASGPSSPQASPQASPRAATQSSIQSSGQVSARASGQGSGRADAVPRPLAGASRSGPTSGPIAVPAQAMPPSTPEDAPVDELIEPPFEPGVDDVSEYERDVFLHLDGELRRLRESAAYEVLGVDEHADVAAIRAAYFELTKRFHPDLFARYRSRAILHMSQELFIHINKAYDRMRNALVAAGHAIVAGPALIPHDGWLAGLDDIQSAGDEPTSTSLIRERSYGEDPPSRAGTGDLLTLVRSGKFEEARERVAAALHYDPRDRRMRALYHVISGRELMSRGEETAAATQFEAALAHDRTCREAREALEELRASGLHSGLYPRTLR